MTSQSANAENCRLWCLFSESHSCIEHKQGLQEARHVALSGHFVPAVSTVFKVLCETPMFSVAWFAVDNACGLQNPKTGRV